ncbi:MAG: Digeranylgeranylglycerophospholipid reductase [Methanosaeta sp. PtaU1.Bin112]|nr:MAG: Digeranylgeranylglycerophospholipid reductase [Methanosaeta sp. PtaU1.Bin112]
MAAKAAAESGLNALLLEKRQEIGEAIRCAEGISFRSELYELVRVQPDWISSEVHGVRMHSPNNDSVSIDVNSKGECGGYILERKCFDRGLALQAARAGARILVKTRATGLVRKDGMWRIAASCGGHPLQIEAPLVIGADGIESKTARWAGIDTRLKLEDIMVCAQFLVADEGIDQDCCEFFFGNRIAPGGYAWIFPKGRGLANVGIGIQGSQSGPGKALSLLERFMQDKMPRGRMLQMVTGGIPTSGPMSSTTSDGIMLVGDAAHQSDPLTGGGIINAMRAGILAGETAGKAVHSGDVSRASLKGYEDRCKIAIDKQLKRRYHAKNLFLKLADEDLNNLIGSLHGKDLTSMNTRSLMSVLFKQNPRMLWRLGVSNLIERL